jgi:hypothetical protein
MRFVTLALILCVASSCASQTKLDPRWRLLPDGKTVQAPLDDLRKAAGFRLTQDSRLLSAVVKISSLEQENDELRAAGALKDRTIHEYDEMNDKCEDQRIADSEGLQKYKRKTTNRNLWAWTATVAALAEAAIIYVTNFGRTR